MPFNIKKILYRKLNVAISLRENKTIPSSIEKDNELIDTTHWTFVLALVAILLGSVLVNLWIRVINNFTYQTLGLKQESTFWALVIAMTMTAVLVVYIIMVLDDNTSCAVKQNITGVAFASSVPAITGAMTLDLNTFNGIHG